MKIKSSPFFCHEKGCRKNIRDTPKYLNNKEDIEYLREILECFTLNDQTRFHKFLKGFTSNITERGFQETKSQMFFYRVVGWPEGNRYYCEGSDNYRKDFFNGFIRDYLVPIQDFLKDK